MNNKETELYNDIYYELSSALDNETAEKIFKMYRGQQITFPMHLYNVKKIRKVLLKEYTGTNIKDLSAKYDYSEKTIRRLLKATESDSTENT